MKHKISKSGIKSVVPVVALSLLLAQFPLASANPLLQHQGTNDPVNEGFIKTGGGPEGPVFPTNDLGTLTWAIHDTNAPLNSGLGYFANLNSTARGMLARTWHVGWNFKIVDETGTNPLLMTFALTNSTGTTAKSRVRYDRMGNDLSVLLDVTGPTINFVNGGIGFHTWDLIRTNPASDVAQFYFDGVFVTNYSGYVDTDANILWGATGGNTTSLSEWAYVFVQEAPEPSALLLIGLSGALVWMRRFRR